MTAVLTGLLVAAGGLFPAAARAASPELDIVAINASGDRRVSLVADVQTTGKRPVPASGFSVTAGGVPQRTKAVPVLTDQAALAVVVDASAAGSAALPEGLSGATNLLLQLPPATRTAVVADTSPPVVLAPPSTGGADAVRALSAVRAQGERATAQALALAAQQLPAVPDGRRVVVLYTSAPDAGGVSERDLARRMAEADTLLAVVGPTSGAAYWSRVASATGGLHVTPRQQGVMSAFDQVASALRSRYVLTFEVPEGLPAEVTVRVATGEGKQTAHALVSPGQVGSTEPGGSASGEGDGMSNVVWYLVLGVLALLGLAAGALVVAARRRPQEGPAAPVTHQRLDSVLRGSPVAPPARPPEPAPESRAEKPLPAPGRGPEAAPTPAPEVAGGRAPQPAPSRAAESPPEPERTAAPEPAPGPVPEHAPEPAPEPAPTLIRQATPEERSSSVAEAVAAAGQRARAVASAAAGQRARAVASAARSAAAASSRRTPPRRDKPE